MFHGNSESGSETECRFFHDRFQLGDDTCPVVTHAFKRLIVRLAS